MEHESVKVSPEDDGDQTRNEATESPNSEVSVKDASEMVSSSPVKDALANATAWKGGGVGSKTLETVETSGEVNMEASVTPEDVIRAGGFGAMDDISSFLPVASDWTDFEASIRDAKDYEEPQGDVCRPGLGWKEASEKE